MFNDAVEGPTITEMIVEGIPPVVTVTLAVPVFEVSCVLCAVMVSEPADAGAVYKPVLVMVPCDAVQVTPLL